MTHAAAILLAVAALALGVSAAHDDAPIVVVDGDTVRRDGIKYRLLGFDAPETWRPHCPEERALGEAATARLRALIAAAHTVELRGNGTLDRYGRTLAALILDGRNAGGVLIAEGLAREYWGGKRRGWCP